ncbi:hypothetical protein KY290_037040 [Solanum tuberosum]|uniref:Uncharacterized protein n=1 Tax=Solanum tuberosum TaxID=4113 RepID=A0ABQ7TY70_SOLTU|nr:hypothetical protein KY290_037040 [Solanum tuberosum]
MKAVGAKDNKSDKNNGGNSMPYIVDDSVEKDNIEPQPTSDQFFQQTISPIQMNFATVDHDIDAYTVEVEINMLLKKMLQSNFNSCKETNEDAGHEAPQSDTKVLSGNEDVADIIQQDFEKYASNSDSTTSASISSGTEAVIDALVYRLPNEPIHVKSLSVIIPLQLTGSDDFLSDSQLPTQLPVKESTHNFDTKTPSPRNRMPSKIMQSLYLTAFGSSDKARGK